MKTLCIGDPHIKDKNLHVIRPVLDEILEVVREVAPDRVVVLGDTLHNHERINMRCMCVAVEFFRRLAEVVPKLYVLIGNHDRENNSDFLSDIHPFPGLATGNIIVVNKPLWEDDAIFVPYVPPGRFLEALSLVGYTPMEGERPGVIFCHQEFKGCNMGSVVSRKGDAWSEQWPRVIAGHIHEYQEMGNIIYPGTFMQQSYGEESEKGLLLLDGEGIRRIPLKSAPIRRTVYLNTASVTTWEEYYNEKELLRVIIECDAGEAAGIKKSPSFKRMREKVDKVEIRTTTKKDSLVDELLKGKRVRGKRIEAIVCDLLEDDEETLDVFKKEIMVE